jgi:hypothetical protein
VNTSHHSQDAASGYAIFSDNKGKVLGRTNSLLPFDNVDSIKETRVIILLFLCVYSLLRERILPSHCLAMIGGTHTEKEKVG